MSKIATYTFLPWLRQGIANQISSHEGIRATISVELTLSGNKIDEGIETKEPIKKNIEIYGPGDIIGIDPKSIIKVEPQNWNTNFEPNYLPYIDFYDEDFPWRYSPLTPKNDRLQPWIMLIILKENEFENGKNIKDRPLAYIKLKENAKLPPSEELWAWTHIHINKDLIPDEFVSSSAENIAANLGNVLRADPDMAYSRILSPRRLENNTPYHAFLVPVFNSGLLAGLGQDPSGAATYDQLAWSNETEVKDFEIPYYYRWYFRTGTVGDFEYLVRLLEPKPVDSRVGLRDMDVQNPGANIQGIIDPSDADEENELGGILRLGGALKIPDSFYTPEEFADVEKYRNWATLNPPYPHPFQQDLAAFINLTDSYDDKSAKQANNKSGITQIQNAENSDIEYDITNNPDPLITAPLYSRWHALTQRLIKDREGNDIQPNNNWVHQLNLDPRWRVAAGFGTEVVQKNQEDYMKSAWEQVGKVLEANKKIKEAQLAKEVSYAWYNNSLKSFKENNLEKWLTIAAPLQKRVINEGITVFHQVNKSIVPRTAVTAPMRKMIRPRGSVAKRLPFNNEITPYNLITRLNKDENGKVAVSPAPPRVTPEGLNTLNDLAKNLLPKKLPDFIIKWLRKSPWLKWCPIIIALIILVLLLIFQPGGLIYAVGVLAMGGCVWSYRKLNQWAKEIADADSINEENQTRESVDQLPKSPDFRISTPGENFTPTSNGEDSDEGKRFKEALRNVNTLLQETFNLTIKPDKPQLPVIQINEVVFQALNPELTVPAWINGSIIVPERIKEQLKDELNEVKAYPEIDLPMYKPLAEKSAELFLPNINYVSQNSISILETNQKFIESYMVGLNHEFARELLWREYPTDQRGSYFRQFWEARGFQDTEGLDEEELKEKLRDIPPIHLWLKKSNLGDHDHRNPEGENRDEVVLVIRSELLKKYPNAVIYAHQGVWKNANRDRIWKHENGKIYKLDADGNLTEISASEFIIDPTWERDLRPLLPEEESNPPRNIIKSPLYEAKVEPDIYFFGFDLTVCEAVGGKGKENESLSQKCIEEGVNWDTPGWFFVIKERPGEPRFGLDIPGEEPNIEETETGNKIEVWNDLRWDNILPQASNEEFIQVSLENNQFITADQDLEEDDNEKEQQQQEDVNIIWNNQMSSAEIAYILYQVPVMVAVHACEMIPEVNN